MQFELTLPQTELEAAFGGHYHINAFGKIDRGDDAKFLRFLSSSAPPPRTCIYINSTGGDVEAAIGIGRLIRRNDLETAVGSYYLDPQGPHEHLIHRKFVAGKCISAATLIFLGGRLRHFNSDCSFGVHQFSFTPSTQEQVEKSQKLSASIARYIEEMGISTAFMEVSADKPGREVTFLSKAQLKEFQVVTGGETEATWKVEMHEEVAYVKGERDNIFGYGKVMLGWAEADGFLFMSMIETMGRENELLNFGLVEIALGEDEEAINISERCARMP